MCSGEDTSTGKEGKWCRRVQECRKTREGTVQPLPAGALADRLMVRTLGQNAVDVGGGEVRI